MRIRKHRNTTVRVVPAAESVSVAFPVRLKTVVKRLEEDNHGNGRSTSSELHVSEEMGSTSTPSVQASPGVSIQPVKQLGHEDGSTLLIEQSQNGKEDGKRHDSARSSNVARKRQKIDLQEGFKREEMRPSDLDLSVQVRHPVVGTSKRKTHPRQTETETVSEAHPATAPEGSLLHTLYLQLLVAGTEGITWRDLLTSFEKQTSLPSFNGNNWKEKVRSHLKSNPNFAKVKGHYLLCTELQHGKLQSRSNPPAAVSSKRTNVSLRTTNTWGRPVRTTSQLGDSVPAVAQPRSLSVEKENKGVQTRKKAYQKTIEAALKESAIEFEKLSQTSLDKSPRATASDFVTQEGRSLSEHHRMLQRSKRFGKQEDGVSKSRRSQRPVVYPTRLDPLASSITRRLKSQSEANMCSLEKEDNMGAHVVEVLVDMQAQPQQIIEADDHTNQVEEELKSKVLLIKETGHSDLSECELGVVPRNVPYEKAIAGSLIALQAKIVTASGGVQTGARCARKDGCNDPALKWQCPLNAAEGHKLCDHHNFLRVRNRARGAVAKITMKEARVKRQGHNKDSKASSNNNMGLPGSHKQSGEVLASLPRRPLKSIEKDESLAHLKTSLKDTRSRYENSDHTEPTDRDDHRHSQSAQSEDYQDGYYSAGEKRQPKPKTAPKRWYVAAKKTAATVGPVKKKSMERETSPLIRPPTISPLPAMHGVRKAVKNRSLCSL